MTFRDALKAEGATTQQLSSPLFRIAENCIERYADIGDDTLREEVAKISKTMQQYTTIVHDQKTQDAINAFRQVLQAAKDILGEDVIKIPEVACALLAEGGYMGWRSIMGEAANTAPTRTASGRRI